MHVVIAGCGRVGSGLARDLVTQGFDVSIIDESPDAFHLLGDDFPGEFVVGRALDWDVLREAGIEDAIAFVACTDGDNTNIVIAQVAQKKYGIQLRGRARLRPAARRAVRRRPASARCAPRATCASRSSTPSAPVNSPIAEG